jgi:excisionase family DNA binding protein
MTNHKSKASKENGGVQPSEKYTPAEHDIESVSKTMSVEQAGRVLGICRGAAYARAADGSLPTIRLGKRLLVPKAALEKLLNVEGRDVR